MRLVDADVLKDKANDTDYMPTGKWLSLSDLEAAETIEPRHGKWIAVEYNDGTVHTECSVCGYGRGVPLARRYCPNCGAKMDEE